MSDPERNLEKAEWCYTVALTTNKHDVRDELIKMGARFRVAAELSAAHAGWTL
jgi:hypothetical protein